VNADDLVAVTAFALIGVGVGLWALLGLVTWLLEECFGVEGAMRGWIPAWIGSLIMWIIVIVLFKDDWLS
jgi:hypothetical protein